MKAATPEVVVKIPRDVHRRLKARAAECDQTTKSLAEALIVRGLAETAAIRSCVICEWAGTTGDLKRNANQEIACPICGSTQIRTGTFEATETAT